MTSSQSLDSARRCLGQRCCSVVPRLAAARRFAGFVLISLAVAAVMLASTTHAGLLVTFEESGSNVTATLSGSFATLPTPVATFPSGPFNNRLNAESPLFDVTSTGSSVNVGEYPFSVNLPAFGPGSGGQNYDASSATANTDFYISGSFLRLADGYTLGSTFSGVLTWANESFASVGLTPGTYATSLLGGDAGATVTVNVVPEPASLTLLAVGLAFGLASGGYGFIRRSSLGQPPGHGRRVGHRFAVGHVKNPGSCLRLQAAAGHSVQAQRSPASQRSSISTRIVGRPGRAWPRHRRRETWTGAAFAACDHALLLAGCLSRRVLVNYHHDKNPDSDSRPALLRGKAARSRE